MNWERLNMIFLVFGRFVGNLLKGQTVGVIGAGRIGSAYARMMVKPLAMPFVYLDPTLLYTEKFFSFLIFFFYLFISKTG